ncbi:ribonuclease 3-like protein 3 [Arabidopsis lyrata subsp. lyrata]|uniref:ribonuclease 3-like protein 3 n=1 Tax=Arabidopsis lyrata subsp. lyrata TaxID=81972 RepID=UPI000A29CBDF|nr:ribonuclease 3-like protein 3 [Arabidopsis lyrata subsp. lyrata]|eukprot:XP_020887805.1 ribonuclease 3-like protein 3 [Arabidopsis lyrata subsp. lyrata]
MESVEAVEKILNYTFTDKNLLKEAITKTSGSNTESSSLLFERLEFLGDSVLLVVFSNHIEITYPNLHPNDLNDVRIANVSNETFARVAVNNNLHQFIIFDAPNPLLHKMIKDFSEAVKEEVYPAPCGGLVKAPKFLADLVEAIAGAVYIDVDFDVQRVWEIFRVLVEPICTLDDLRKQPERTYLRLLGLGDKLGKRIEVLYTKAKEGTNIHVFKVYLGDLLIAWELFQICKNNNWPNPIFSFEEEGGPKIEQKFVCSVNIEIPSVESIFHMKGDAKSTKTQAQNSSAYYMIGALKSSLMSHVKSNLPIEKSLDEKISSNIEIPSVESVFHMKGDAKSTKEQAKNSSAYYMIGALKSSLMSHVKSNLPIEKSLDEKISSNESCLPHERSLESLSSEIDSDPVKAVEKILNYSFTNKNLLREALTHNSSNLLPFQRLMFVGKAGISLAFANHMYLTYPKLGPKELTMLQNANTCNDRYARVAVKRGIYQFLKCNVRTSKRQIIEFIKMLGKEDDPDPFRSVKAPKILTDLVESVAGAVYIDVNRDVKRLWEILRGLFEPIYTLDDIRRKPHPLLTLFCLGYKHGKRIEFRYRECEKSSGMNEATITEVYVDDKFIACGKSCNRAASKMRAATMALEKLSESMPIELVMDDSIEYENSKKTLIEICNERKWPNPIFSVERSSKRFVSSVTIETPTEEGTLYIEGDLEKGKEKAEYNAASHVVRTLKASPLGLVVRNLKRKQISLDEEEIVVKENKDEQEILHRNKRKRRRR